MGRDFILDDNNDLLIKNGDFVIGATTMQDVGIIIQMNPGELKEDPVLGAGLVRLIKSNATQEEVEAIVKLHLKRDDKNYDTIKNQIKFNLKTN